MEERKDPMDKLIEAAYEYADERIMEVQDLYRMKAEKMVETLNQYRAWAKDAENDADRRELGAVAFGIEKTLEEFGFRVIYSFITETSYLMEWQTPQKSDILVERRKNMEITGKIIEQRYAVLDWKDGGDQYETILPADATEEDGIAELDREWSYLTDHDRKGRTLELVRMAYVIEDGKASSVEEGEESAYAESRGWDWYGAYTPIATRTAD